MNQAAGLNLTLQDMYYSLISLNDNDKDNCLYWDRRNSDWQDMANMMVEKEWEGNAFTCATLSAKYLFISARERMIIERRKSRNAGLMRNISKLEDTLLDLVQAK